MFPSPTRPMPLIAIKKNTKYQIIRIFPNSPFNLLQLEKDIFDKLYMLEK